MRIRSLFLGGACATSLLCALPAQALNILVTNDDGINVPGLWLLVDALRPLGKVTVVAPDREQSGVGQAISLAKAMRMHRIPFSPEGVDCYSIEGTPGDAVIVALGHVLKNEQVDLVVSGVNRGANTAAERFLSGTMGAAWHGLIRGLTAIAASAAYRATDPTLEPGFEVGAAVAGELARLVAEGSAPRDVLYNVNAPLCTVGQLQGLFHARPGQALYNDEVREEDDGRGKH